MPYGNVAANLINRGMCDKAVEDATMELRLRPSAIFPNWHVAEAFVCLGRYSDAKRTVENAFARGVDGVPLHRVRYKISHSSTGTP